MKKQGCESVLTVAFSTEKERKKAWMKAGKNKKIIATGGLKDSYWHGRYITFSTINPCTKKADTIIKELRKK